MKKILLFISIIGILMTSGCTTDKQSSTANNILQNSIIYVDIKNSSFEPDNIAIIKGQTITWTNSDGAVHTVKSVTGEFDSGLIKPGQKFSYKFNMDGRYQYYCTIHSTMHNGKIDVTSLG